MKSSDILEVINENKDQDKKEILSFFIIPKRRQSSMEYDHNEALKKLSKNYLSLSSGQLGIILKLAEKF